VLVGAAGGDESVRDLTISQLETGTAGSGGIGLLACRELTRPASAIVSAWIMMVSHGWQTKDGCEESLSCAVWAGHAATAVVVSNKCWLRPLVDAHDGIASL
jgi:hypothetical protein